MEGGGGGGRQYGQRVSPWGEKLRIYLPVVFVNFSFPPTPYQVGSPCPCSSCAEFNLSLCELTNKNGCKRLKYIKYQCTNLPVIQFSFTGIIKSISGYWFHLKLLRHTSVYSKSVWDCFFLFQKAVRSAICWIAVFAGVCSSYWSICRVMAGISLVWLPGFCTYIILSVRSFTAFVRLFCDHSFGHIACAFIQYLQPWASLHLTIYSWTHK